MPGGKSPYGALKSQKQYLKLIAANVVNRCGDSLDVVVFSWVMYQVTDNASLVALIFALNYVPNIILQPFSGAFVERFPKRRVMVACDIGRAVLASCTGGLLLAGVLNVPCLILITMCTSTLECFRIPAGAALVPEVLDSGAYAAGVSLNQTLSRVSEIVGKAAAGAIVGLFGSPAALFLDALAFVGSGLIISRIPCREGYAARPLESGGFMRDFAGGFRYVRGSRILMMMLLLGALINFSSIPLDAFQAVYVGGSLGMGPEMLSLFSVAMTGGMAAGSLLCPCMRREGNGRLLVAGFGSMTGVCMALLWLFPHGHGWPVAVGVAAVFLLSGFSNGVISVIFSTMFLTSVEPGYMARVSGISNAVMLSTIPLGSLICSALARALPVPVVFLCTAVPTIAAYLLIMRVKALRGL